MSKLVVAVKRDRESTLAGIFTAAGITLALPENLASPRHAILELDADQEAALRALPDLIVEEIVPHGTNPPSWR